MRDVNSFNDPFLLLQGSDFYEPSQKTVKSLLQQGVMV